MTKGKIKEMKIIFGGADNVSQIIEMVQKSFQANSLSALPASTALTAAAAAYLFCLILFFRRKSFGQNLCLLLLFLYSAMLFSLTVPVVLPKNWHISKAATEWVLRSIQWVPFVSASHIFQNAAAAGSLQPFIRIIGGNFLALMPLGILVPLIDRNFRFGRMFLLAVLVPVCIEGLQLAADILAGQVLRNVEVEDVILNAAGCLLAYLILAGIRRASAPKHRAKHYRP
jgi:glycopeptide antibiotics resistance protein